MNANIKEANSAGLGLQPEVSLQAPVTICPKCQHKRTPDDQGPGWQCPSCGIAYNKVAAAAVAATPKANSVGAARAREEVRHEEWEPATPGAISFSLQGRIGRLRYLAFSWPIMALSGLGMLAAVLHKTPSTVLIIAVLVVWFWMWLRLMALRLHDMNRSAKWLLALLLLPGVLTVLGGPKLGAIGALVFWMVAFVLIVLPGSEGDNDYGPPPGPNTTLIAVGAGLVLVLMMLGVVGNIRYARFGKLNPALLGAQDTVQAHPRE